MNLLENESSEGSKEKTVCHVDTEIVVNMKTMVMDMMEKKDGDVDEDCLAYLLSNLQLIEASGNVVNVSKKEEITDCIEEIHEVDIVNETKTSLESDVVLCMDIVDELIYEVAYSSVKNCDKIIEEMMDQVIHLIDIKAVSYTHLTLPTKRIV